MFQRRLQALGYLEWEKVDPTDPQHFQKVTVWLEDQKIRQYKIDDRRQLRNIQDANWLKVFARYCKDVECPVLGNELGQLEWLLGYAIWLEVEPRCDGSHKSIIEKKAKAKAKTASVDYLKSGDFKGKPFKREVNSLAKLLRVPRHPNQSLTLAACGKLVRERLNPAVLRKPKSKIVRGKPFPVMSVAPGFNLTDTALENAAKCLALLYIQDIRKLQTKINETIVRMQSFTANPKTDTRLGKVGK